MMQKILFSNIGYAKGIDGTLWQHISRVGRHIYTTMSTQTLILKQIKAVIEAAEPDICCFVEIDQGSFHSAYINQLSYLADDHYEFFDIANKYGDDNWRRHVPFLKGRSNAFLSKQELVFDRLYFKHGTKRLMYRLVLPGNIHVFFAHFSLDRSVRARQFGEVRAMIEQCPGDAILLADFNIMYGFSELSPLLDGTNMKLLSREEDFTFLFYKQRLALDLCLCSEALASRIALKVIDQPFSDHQALLVEIAED